MGLAVALVGIAASGLLGRQQAESIDTVEETRFVQATNSAVEVLARRIDAYVEIAFGLRGLFVVNPDLDRRSFSEALRGLDVGTRYPRHQEHRIYTLRKCKRQEEL